MKSHWAASAALIVAVILSGCAGFRPHPVDGLAFPERSQSQVQDELRVTVAVPTIEEAQAMFDSSLHLEGIQPIWIEIENHGDEPVWVHPFSIDPGYFTPLEVAWSSHRSLSPKTNTRIDEYFRNQAIPSLIPRRSSASGFVFVNLERGTKYIPIEVLGADGIQRFEFFVRVPGLTMDYDLIDFDRLYEADEIEVLEDEEAVRRWAATLPCCTFDRSGSDTGDPINVILIASHQALQRGFLRTGWSETAALSMSSALKTAVAAVSEDAYPNAPFSALYVLGRAQDIGLQKARQNVHQRNHIRLWLAPVTYRSTPVWIGQISRDIGSKVTSKSATLTTHKIDPDVDDARNALLLDLYRAQVIEAYGFVGGVGEAAPESPRDNLTGDPYFTDGLRAVIFLSDEPVPGDPVRFLPWEELRDQ